MSLLGRLLRGVHAGERHLAWNHPAAASAPATITLSSASFANGGAIPERHAGRGVGDNVSPPLSFDGVPADAMELVLIVEDPDAPVPRPFVHAVALSIAPALGEIAAGRLSAPQDAQDGIVLGKNTIGKCEYGGPRPLRGHGAHTYVFQIFALDRRLHSPNPPKKSAVLRQMQGAVIARGRLDGTYER